MSGEGIEGRVVWPPCVATPAPTAAAISGELREAQELLFPELANELPHNRARFVFADEVTGQIERVAALLAERDDLAAKVAAVRGVVADRNQATRGRLAGALFGRVRGGWPGSLAAADDLLAPGGVVADLEAKAAAEALKGAAGIAPLGGRS